MKLIGILAVAALASFGMVTLSRAVEPVPTDFPKTVAVSEQIVKGDVLMREGEFYIVKDITGHEVRLHVNKETKLDGVIKVGDKIEARVTSEGHATSITSQLPQNGTAPVLPNTGPTSPQRSPAGSVLQ